MSRPVTTLAVFFVAMNSFARVLRATGVDDALHLDANVGTNDAVSKIPSEEIATGTPTGSTLFGMYNVLTGHLTNIYEVIFPGLAMLQRAGVPDYLTQMVLAPLFGLIVAVAVLSYLRGYSL